MLCGLTRAQDVHRSSRGRGHPIARSHDERSAAVGDDAALRLVERVGHQRRVEHVADGEQLSPECPGIAARPLALHRHHRRQLLVGDPELLHESQRGGGEHRVESPHSVELLELPAGGEGIGAERRVGVPGATRFAVHDQHRGGLAGRDRRASVTDVKHVGASADAGGIDPLRDDAEVVRDVHGEPAR